jgi:23S rRNA pseudouridine1911/1915/1917 synthase
MYLDLRYDTSMKAKARTAGTLQDAILEMMESASITSVRRLIKNHRVTVDGQMQPRPDFAVLPGQTIEISQKGKEGKKRAPGPAPLKTARGAKRRLAIRILLEDEHLIVVDKPTGMLSIATDKERRKTLYWKVMDYVKESTAGKGRIFIVHRLDRDASGVMVLAKDEKTKRKLQKNWAGTQKVYRAVVEGRPPRAEGTVRNFLCENRAKRVYVCDKDVEGSQEAVTHYRILRGQGPRRLIEVTIETGRKHQIRVHMASTLRCPILGHDMYGLGKSGTRGIALHSHSLTFDHPATGKRITVKSPVPGRFRGMV